MKKEASKIEEDGQMGEETVAIHSSVRMSLVLLFRDLADNMVEKPAH